MSSSTNGTRFGNDDETSVVRQQADLGAMNHNETVVIREGIFLPNHNETVVAVREGAGLAGANHNETVAIREGVTLSNHNETVVIREAMGPNHNETVVAVRAR